MSVRLALYSDLHLEFGLLPATGVNADIVVLAGDIYTKCRAWRGGRAAEFFGCPIVGILGNHEFFDGQIDTAVGKTRIAAAEHGITLLECQETVIGNVRLIGCSLWSDFRLFAGDDLRMVRSDANLCVGDRYSRGQNDFRCIRVAADGYRKFRPLDAATLHRESVAWLDRRLAVPFDGPTVVITHHAPSMRCLPPEWRDDHRMAAYASHLDWLVERHQPAVWCYGHVHENVPAFRIGDTLMISNPRGYAPDHLNRNFDPCLTITV